MPVHGIRLDLEFAAIVVVAAAASYFFTSQLISNVMFTVLLGALFFLIGLHMDIGKVKNNLHKKRELVLGLAMVYLIVPILAFGVAQLVGGGLGEAMIAIGVSAAAVGSPLVWSNLGKGEGGTALVIASLSLLLGIVLIPILLAGFSTSIPLLDFAAKNVGVIGIPLLAGIFAQRFDNFLIEDMKHHFSKVALWLLVLVMAVQFQLIYQARGLTFLKGIGFGTLVLTGFVALSFALAYFSARHLGVMERKARAIGFVSSSKGIGIALFIAAQMSGEAVAYVTMYYFVRQAVCGTIAEYFHHGEAQTIKELTRFRMPHA